MGFSEVPSYPPSKKWGSLLSFEAISHGRLEGLDYRSVRPFSNWQRPLLMVSIRYWISLNPPRLELATMAYEELKYRSAAKGHSALRLFPSDLPPIPWLNATRKRVLSELKPSSTPRGRGNLYVVLRSGYTEMNGFYGAYVGVTSHPVEQRFLQHRTGEKSARGLPVHGIELLYSLFSWANPIPGANEVRRAHETALHNLLKRSIPQVSGDTVPADALTEAESKY